LDDNTATAYLRFLIPVIARRPQADAAISVFTM
jgi:hypothetical protein